MFKQKKKNRKKMYAEENVYEKEMKIRTIIHLLM